MRDIKVHIKGINVHLDDLEAWKKGVDSQLGNLASSILRASGNLPGKTKDNPMGHVATMDLRSGRKLPDSAIKMKDAMLNNTLSVLDGTT